MTPDAGPTTPGWLRPFGLTERRASVLVLVLVAGVMILAIVLRDRLPGVETLGYPAVFIVSVVGNATLLFPVPALLVVCTGGILLNPLLVGITGGAGQALGEMTGYLAGMGGQSLITKNRIYMRIQPWMQKRGWIAVLIFAIIPNPIFDFIGLAAGASRMPVWKFLAAATIGKTLRSILVAYSCTYGWPYVQDFFRVLDTPTS